MKKSFYLVIILGAAVIVGGYLAFPSAPLPSITTVDSGSPRSANGEVTLAISDGKGATNNTIAGLEEGMTAFDLLKKGTEELGLSLETKVYDIGVLIDAIGSTKNGQDNKYWMYYVNGETPMVAADKMILKAGDQVEFKFETSTF